MTLNKIFTYLFLLTLFTISSCRIDDGHSVVILPLPYETFDQMFEAKEVPAQHFSANAGEEIKITGEKGTLIIIPSSTLKDSDGEVLEGEVDIVLKELTTNSDMIFSNKPTVSNGELLESGGTFFLSVKKNEETISTSEEYFMSVPIRNAVSAPENMNLFTGQISDGLIDWNLSESSSVDVDGDDFNVSTKKTDWVSINYFYKKNDPQTNLEITPVAYEGTLTDVVCFLVFEDINSVVRMDYDDASKMLKKDKLPLDAKIKIILLATNDDYYYMGVQSLIIAENESIEVELSTVTMDEIEKEIMMLN